MINFVFLIVILINVASTYYYRNYSSDDERTAFLCGVISLAILPLVVKGMFLSMTNLQNIWGNLSHYSAVNYILILTTTYSAAFVFKVIQKKISAYFENGSSKQDK